MCFSAEASFGAAATLVPAGVYCMRGAVIKDRAYLPMATVPLFFGVQQFCEGLVWLGIGRQDQAFIQATSLVYLFFAIPFWPFWIPFCAIFFESCPKRKAVIGLITLAGLTVGLLLYLPIAGEPDLLETRLADHSSHYDNSSGMAPKGTHGGTGAHAHQSIRYDISRGLAFTLLPPLAWQILYLGIVAAPFVVSSVPSMKGYMGFGIALFLSAMVSHFFFRYAFVSVWCFFAAILSLMLCHFFWTLPMPAESTDGAHKA